jgi:hypothetical protein
MKKVPTPLFTLLAFVFFFSSCANYYYSPNDGDLVMLKEQHDGHISAASNLGGSDNKKVLNIQAGYSPIKHLAFAGSYFNLSDGDKTRRYGNGYILNGSIGGYYFFPIPDGNRNGIIQFNNPNLNMEKGILIDLYAGSGEGKVRNFYEEGGRSQFKFRKDYIQFGIHWIRRNWGISYNARRGRLNYSEGTIYNRLKINRSDLDKFDELTVNNSFDLTEHSFRLHIGIKHCRYFLTITSVNETTELSNLGVENSNFNVGLILEIDAFFRNKIKKENKREF